MVSGSGDTVLRWLTGSNFYRIDVGFDLYRVQIVIGRQICRVENETFYVFTLNDLLKRKTTKKRTKLKY
jgi:hypothetical protein